jgi:selenide,water dikinase
VASATQLNNVGADLATIAGVHGITDVTGFGLLGHGLEMCRGSGLGAQLSFDALPFLDGVAAMARGGTRTGASARNWDSYGEEADLAGGLAKWQRDLLTDPQTSGGLLVAVEQAALSQALDCIGEAGFGRAAVIGEMVAGKARISVA